MHNSLHSFFSLSSGAKNGKYDLNGFFGNSGYQGKNRRTQTKKKEIIFSLLHFSQRSHSSCTPFFSPHRLILLTTTSIISFSAIVYYFRLFPNCIFVSPSLCGIVLLFFAFVCKSRDKKTTKKLQHLNIFELLDFLFLFIFTHSCITFFVLHLYCSLYKQRIGCWRNGVFHAAHGWCFVWITQFYLLLSPQNNPVKRESVLIYFAWERVFFYYLRQASVYDCTVIWLNKTINGYQQWKTLSLYI